MSCAATEFLADGSDVSPISSKFTEKSLDVSCVVTCLRAEKNEDVLSMHSEASVVVEKSYKVTEKFKL